jgi:hypothetical protein
MAKERPIQEGATFDGEHSLLRREFERLGQAPIIGTTLGRLLAETAAQNPYGRFGPLTAFTGQILGKYPERDESKHEEKIENER